MPSIVSMLQSHAKSKSEYEELAEEMFKQVAEKEHDEEADLKTHVDACAKRFKLLTILDLHNLSEIRKVKQWVLFGAFFVVFGKHILATVFGLFKGMTLMEALQLFLSF